MNNIIFLGAPGSGKGTQASILSKYLMIPTISTGNILRLQVEQKTKIGLEAKNYMDKGLLVPDDIVIDIIKNRLDDNDCTNGFIVDGFPRNKLQAKIFDKSLADISKNISNVIYLEVSDDILIKRISGRYSCKNCGASYNKFFNNTKKPSICDECGSKKLYSRDDDNEEAVTRRIKVYNEDTKELIDFYQKKGLINKVDGLKPIDLVKKDIKNIFN